MKKHLWQLVLKTIMRVVLNVKEPPLTTNQIIISNRALRGTNSDSEFSSSELLMDFNFSRKPFVKTLHLHRILSNDINRIFKADKFLIFWADNKLRG